MADTKSLLKASLTTRRARELGDAAHLAGTSMSATKQTGLTRAKDKADAKSELLQSLETTPVKDIVGPLGGFVVDEARVAGAGLPRTNAAASDWLLNFLNRAPAKPLTSRSAPGQVPKTPVALPLATA